MKFMVYAVALLPDGTPVRTSATNERGGRWEQIDTDEATELWGGITSPWALEERYEAFWNRLSPTWETDFPRGKEKVKVLMVVELPAWIPETSVENWCERKLREAVHA